MSHLLRDDTEQVLLAYCSTPADSIHAAERLHLVRVSAVAVRGTRKQAGLRLVPVAGGSFDRGDFSTESNATFGPWPTYITLVRKRYTTNAEKPYDPMMRVRYCECSNILVGTAVANDGF